MCALLLSALPPASRVSARAHAAPVQLCHRSNQAVYSVRCCATLNMLAIQVTEWVLNPVRMLWSSPQWQQRLTSLDAFLACFSPVQQAPDGSVQVSPHTYDLISLPMPASKLSWCAYQGLCGGRPSCMRECELGMFILLFLHLDSSADSAATGSGCMHRLGCLQWTSLLCRGGTRVLLPLWACYSGVRVSQTGSFLSSKACQSRLVCRSEGASPGGSCITTCTFWSGQ